MIKKIFATILLLIFATPVVASAPPPYQQLLDHINTEAARYGVPAAAIKAVIKTESAWKPHAVSKAGAMGLMQLMPDTARRFGVNNAFDPIQNITGGTRYLAWLHARFGGNWHHILAGYNAGEGAVDRYGGIPPYNETINYVKKVMVDFQQYSRWGGEPPPILMQPIPVRASGGKRKVYRGNPNVVLTSVNAPTTVQWQPPVNYYE